MKNFITVCLLLVGLTMFGQEDKTLLDKTKETVSEYVDLDVALSKVNDIEELFVHYSKEVAEGSKAIVGSTIEVVEQTVTLLVEQSTIVVKQYLVYTSISYALPIIIGLLLIFLLPKIVTKRFSTDSTLAIAHNTAIDDESKKVKPKDKGIYDIIDKSKKKFLSSGVYFNSKLALVSTNLITYTAYIGGTYLVFINIMPFIKVTFFSKLFLVELLLKYF